MSDIKTTLEELHDELARDLLKQIKGGEADASTIRNAIAFLKNNGVELATLSTHDLEEELNGKTIPFDLAAND